MQFFTISSLAVLAAGALAMPADPKTNPLEARADCGQILPACNGGSISGQTDCRCPGQISSCDVWNCPGDDVVGHHLPSRHFLPQSRAYPTLLRFCSTFRVSEIRRHILLTPFSP